MHDSHQDGYRYARPQACIDELLAALRFYRDNWEFWSADDTADGEEGWAPTETLVSDHGNRADNAIHKAKS